MYIQNKSARVVHMSEVMLFFIGGEHAPSKTTSEDWFKRFRSSDFDEDAPDDELLKTSQTVNGHRYRQQLINKNYALLSQNDTAARQRHRTSIVQDTIKNGIMLQTF
ncbi:hypothetical protein CEXT_544561 [Caerostris extrusa]|uniref:Transposase n=1 Tax=Caerostris extrusa TaxID=172846 RepID=A0AAV4MZW9_CAEEX|nr:hypothetical protein CEXT_544561 [Caerostris extrusa]